MAFSRNVWNQLKNLTAKKIITALERDGWVREITGGATLAFYKEPRRRIVIHYHPNKTYGPKFLKGILEDIGWTEKEMKS